MLKLLRQPLAPLIIFAVVLSVFFTLYLLESRDISLLFETITSGFWSLLFIYWIIADTRRQQLDTCTDFGFLCVMFFPLSIPWHCFRSRGWRGLLTLLFLIVIWLSPYFIVAFLWSTLGN